MKRTILCTLILLSAAIVAFAQDGTMKGGAGDYAVETGFDSAVSIREANGLTVVVKDASGKTVTDVTLVTEQYMAGSWGRHRNLP